MASGARKCLVYYVRVAEGEKERVIITCYNTHTHFLLLHASLFLCAFMYPYQTFTRTYVRTSWICSIQKNDGTGVPDKCRDRYVGHNLWALFVLLRRVFILETKKGKTEKKILLRERRSCRKVGLVRP